MLTHALSRAVVMVPTVSYKITEVHAFAQMAILEMLAMLVMKWDVDQTISASSTNLVLIGNALTVVVMFNVEDRLIVKQIII